MFEIIVVCVLVGLTIIMVNLQVSVLRLESAMITNRRKSNYAASVAFFSAALGCAIKEESDVGYEEALKGISQVMGELKKLD